MRDGRRRKETYTLVIIVNLGASKQAALKVANHCYRKQPTGSTLPHLTKTQKVSQNLSLVTLVQSRVQQ
jgi:hypothetical protein